MQRVGSRAQVMHGNAKMTGGGLRKKDLKYNKQGKIVSKKMSTRAKKEKRLQKAGWVTTKGQFGAVQRGGTGNENLMKGNEKLMKDPVKKKNLCKFILGPIIERIKVKKDNKDKISSLKTYFKALIDLGNRSIIRLLHTLPICLTDNYNNYIEYSQHLPLVITALKEAIYESKNAIPGSEVEKKKVFEYLNEQEKKLEARKFEYLNKQKVEQAKEQVVEQAKKYAEGPLTVYKNSFPIEYELRSTNDSSYDSSYDYFIINKNTSYEFRVGLFPLADIPAIKDSDLNSLSEMRRFTNPEASGSFGKVEIYEMIISGKPNNVVAVKTYYNNKGFNKNKNKINILQQEDYRQVEKYFVPYKIADSEKELIMRYGVDLSTTIDLVAQLGLQHQLLSNIISIIIILLAQPQPLYYTDLKPENILLSFVSNEQDINKCDIYVCLIDFDGLATFDSKYTTTEQKWLIDKIKYLPVSLEKKKQIYSTESKINIICFSLLTLICDIIPQHRKQFIDEEGSFIQEEWKKLPFYLQKLYKKADDFRMKQTESESIDEAIGILHDLLVVYSS